MISTGVSRGTGGHIPLHKENHFLGDHLLGKQVTTSLKKFRQRDLFLVFFID